MKTGKQTLLSIALAASLLVVAVQGVLLFWFFATYNPYIVTNPDYKQFDPKQFQFSHYNHLARNEHEFNKALLKMFPPGTDKAYVEQILIKQAHATASPVEITKYHDPGDTDYSYIYGSWQVRFIFDSNNKSKMMKTGGVLHYGHDPKSAFWRERGHERE